MSDINSYYETDNLTTLLQISRCGFLSCIWLLRWTENETKDKLTSPQTSTLVKQEVIHDYRLLAFDLRQ